MTRHLLGILMMTLLLSASAPEARAQETEASCPASSPIKQLRLQEASAAPASGNAFWELADGPYGGHIRDLVTLADGTILALGGPIFRSGDGGASWDRVAGDAHGLVPPGGKNGAVYYYRGSCLYVSHDSGRSWQPECLSADSLGLYAPLGLYIEDVAVTSTGLRVARLFAWQTLECDGGHSALVRSQGGGPWEVLESYVSDDVNVSVLADTLLVRYSGSYVALRESSDTWTALPRVPGDVRSLAGHPSDTLLAGTREGLFQLADTSAGWEALDLEEDGAEGRAVNDVQQLADGRVCVAGPGVQCRRGRGAFEMVGSADRLGHLLGSLKTLTATSDGQLIVGGHWRGIYRYATGTGTWQMSNEGMRQHALHVVAEAAGGQLYGVAGTNLYVSGDGGNGWQLRTHHLEGGAEALFVTEGGALLRATSREVYRSTDGGWTWQRVSSGPGIDALVQQPDGTLVGVSTAGAFSAPASGETWRQIGTLDTTRTGSVPYVLRDMTQGPDGTLYVATGDGVQRSIDGGASWEMVLEEGAGGMADAALAVTSAGTVLAVYPRLVHRSTDRGASWHQVQSIDGFRSSEIRAVAGLDSTVYFTDVDDLWISTDDGQTWTRSEDGSGVGTFYALHMTSEGYLLAGAGRGAYRSRRARPTSAEEKHVPTPGRALLQPVAPNPLRDRATLRYHLAVPGEVRLTLYDVLGRHVRTLTAGRQGPGEHELQLEAGGLAPGTYFIRLETSEGVQAQPLVVVQ